MNKPTATVSRSGSGRLSRRHFLLGSSAALAVSGLNDVAGRSAYAQEASPGATPEAEAMDRKALERLIQFIHPHKVFFYLPGFEDEALIAGIYGVDAETYREIAGGFDANARRAAEELLADTSFAARVDQLPFQAGQTVVGVGESTTDDLQSWLEILRHLLDLRRPQDQIQVINHGISARTTAETLGFFLGSLALQPHWLLVMLGSNDSARLGDQPTKTRVSLDETVKNLEELRHYAETESAASLVWLTPPTVNEELVNAYPEFQLGQFTVSNDDVVAIGDALRAQFDPVVDLQAVFGRPAKAEYLPDDGVHPSLAGHMEIVRAFVERLTT